jgi:FkbM family methyltransferase
VKQGIKEAARFAHLLASKTRCIAKLHISFLSAISRIIDHPGLSQRISNSVSHVSWPSLDFAPRRVRAAGIEMFLYPHIGEYDAEVLFSRTVTYEASSFAWFRRGAPKFDAIIEIGANVGVFTVFFDHLARRSNARLACIYSFEPAPVAFERLRRNVEANQCTHLILHNAAVGEQSGTLPFYEPEGHLSNGTLDRAFAEQIPTKVVERMVPVVGAQELEPLFAQHESVLLKIDVEGYEPKLITALAQIIARFRPTIIIEVLEGTVLALNSLECLRGYLKYLLDADVSEHPRVFASSVHRDWLLVPR